MEGGGRLGESDSEYRMADISSSGCNTRKWAVNPPTFPGKTGLSEGCAVSKGNGVVIDIIAKDNPFIINPE